MHFSCPFHDFQLKLCALTAPHIAHLVLPLLSRQYITYWISGLKSV